jgi:hypothetical protein
MDRRLIDAFEIKSKSAVRNLKSAILPLQETPRSGAANPRNSSIPALSLSWTKADLSRNCTSKSKY